jgi:hypothetical protein
MFLELPSNESTTTTRGGKTDAAGGGYGRMIIMN